MTEGLRRQGWRDGLLVWELLAVVVLGCEPTANLGQLADDLAGTTDSSGESGSGTSTDSSSGASTDSTSDSSDSSDSTDLPPPPDGGDMGACMTMPGDGVCVDCIAEFCCMELTFCWDTPSCACMLQCPPDMPPPECAMFCMPGFEYFALSQCRDTACGAVCP